LQQKNFERTRNISLLFKLLLIALLKVMFTVAPCLIKFRNNVQVTVIRLLYSEVTKLLKFTGKRYLSITAIGSFRMQFMIVCMLQNKAEDYCTERPKWLVTRRYESNI